ncbi:hypothetical protein BpHYR1_001454 [Brachionus plicatilis]|uniref:Uncharacterized protein n=1 Tax=Brachionus plicatilis TaxID=10195 RepID=A0A3M7T4H3_BRAPC|nr:hypothetical protein BpHYR1_001454 [Brachionus plicatilis]
MQNDIYIRRVTSEYGSAEKTVVKLFNFLKSKIGELDQSTQVRFGSFDYVIVPQTTSRNQNDYVAFVAFKDRSIHREVVREFQRVLPLNFGSRGMLFELNHKQTSTDLRIENRRRFRNALKNQKQSNKRYFEVSSDEDERPEPKKQKSFSLDLPKASKEDDISNEPWTRPIPQNILEELNRKIPEFLEKTRSGKKKLIQKKPPWETLCL